MRIELLWWEGCPSHPQALAELRQILSDEGIDPETVERREITTDEQAEREGFPGSPTILIEGRDVVPTEGVPSGLTCRLYRLRDGRPSPTPAPEDVRAAVRRAQEEDR
jgi:hypothetical protein